MEIADLKTLVAVVEHGSITNAAKELNRVPSGVTTRILQLEDSLGVQLFLREKKRLVVTSKGQELCGYAKRVMDLIAEAQRRMQCEEPGGKFRIGTMESTLASRLTEPLAKLHAQYARLRLELTTGTSRSLYDLLMENQLDAVFISDPPADERTEFTLVFEEELVFVAPRTHGAIHEPADLAQDTVLAFKDGCSYRNRMLSWFRAYGRDPERIAALPSYHAIMGGASSGMGVGIVPASVVELFAKKETFSVHQFAHPLAKAPTALTWRRGMLSANISALQECLTVE